jgi:hypothetical protein
MVDAKGRLTVCVSRWWAGWDSLREQKKPEARKMPENAAESHQSAARFVGTLLTCKTHCLKKDTTAELLKLLHEPLALATTKKHDKQKRWVNQKPMLSVI